MAPSRLSRTQTGYHKDITAYLMQSIYVGLATTAIAGTGLFIGNNGPLWAIWTTVTTCTVSSILLTTVRNERLVVRLVARFIEQQGEQNETKK